MYMENLQWVSIDISVIDIDNISIEYLLIALKKTKRIHQLKRLQLRSPAARGPKMTSGNVDILSPRKTIVNIVIRCYKPHHHRFYGDPKGPILESWPVLNVWNRSTVHRQASKIRL